MRPVEDPAVTLPMNGLASSLKILSKIKNVPVVRILGAGGVHKSAALTRHRVSFEIVRDDEYERKHVPIVKWRRPEERTSRLSLGNAAATPPTLHVTLPLFFSLFFFCESETFVQTLQTMDGMDVDR